MVLEVGFYSSLQGFIGEFASGGSGASIVVVLGAATAQDRTRILRAGADACFCQPYSFIEMHERMAALQRVGGARGALGGSASASVSASVLPVAGGPALDAATRELVCGARRVAVTRREFLLLECLLRQVSAPVARDQLIRYAWPEKEDVDPSSVNLVVSRLRRKLSEDVPEVRIETVSRFGYQVSVCDCFFLPARRFGCLFACGFGLSLICLPARRFGCLFACGFGLSLICLPARRFVCLPVALAFP
ncbi:response regulator transcription factor [Paraburkholderia polaris]|uniref:response regulator transcription factor n=1 Tax=Paraburkholderia polaris TaxID=2728848 RepID=UPI002E3220F1|nr:winged helix-turn-helix domain-containing protein [Paraburkholderia polaris]